MFLVEVDHMIIFHLIDQFFSTHEKTVLCKNPRLIFLEASVFRVIHHFCS